MDGKWRTFFREADESDWSSISELPFSKPTKINDKQFHSKFHRWQSRRGEHRENPDGIVFTNTKANTGILAERKLTNVQSSESTDINSDNVSLIHELASEPSQSSGNFQPTSGEIITIPNVIKNAPFKTEHNTESGARLTREEDDTRQQIRTFMKHNKVEGSHIRDHLGKKPTQPISISCKMQLKVQLQQIYLTVQNYLSQYQALNPNAHTSNRGSIRTSGSVN